MTWEIAYVLALAAGAMILFATEKLSTDMVAILVMVALLVSGILTPAEGFAGFSNTATVTVAAMFVLSAGLSRTGAVNFVGGMLARVAKRSMLLLHVAMMVSIATVSAFLNNTATVAILIPVVIGVARASGTSPSKLLIPLSFASMFGGVCTLIGTSTNILGSSIAERHGQPAFSMFELTKLGLIFFVIGAIYMLTLGRRLIPSRRGADDLTQSYGMGAYLTEITLGEDAISVGKPLAEAPLLEGTGIEVLEIRRDGHRIALPQPHTVLRAGDVLRVACQVEDIARLRHRKGISFTAASWASSDDDETKLVEAVVAPSSMLIGKTVAQVRFRDRFGGTVLAIRHRGDLMRGTVQHLPLSGGDALLVEIRVDQLQQLQKSRAFLLISESPRPDYRRRKIPIGVGIIVAVVAIATLGLAPIAVTAVAGAVLMVLTGCLDPDDAYDAVEWKVLFLLGGMLALGAAMEKTGAARLIADWLVSMAGDLGPVAILSALYLLTSLLTEVMSNNAAVALLAPIAIVTANAMTLSPRPFVIAVLFAASSSFMTPVGYQTNTMIYGPGQYRFSDFFRVGAPLNLLFWIAATIFIPWLWPLTLAE